MCPEDISSNCLILLVPQEGFEPPTHALRMRCSTPELLRHCSLFSFDWRITGLSAMSRISPSSATNRPGEVVRAVERVTLGDRVVLPYTMTELRRNLPRRNPAAPHPARRGVPKGVGRGAGDAPLSCRPVTLWQRSETGLQCPLIPGRGAHDKSIGSDAFPRFLT